MALELIGSSNWCSFNDNDIWMHICELSKLLQEVNISLLMLSERYLEFGKTAFIPKYHICRTNHFPSMKGEIAVKVRKVTPRNHVHQFYVGKPHGSTNKTIK
jgi:hypothetical protein